MCLLAAVLAAGLAAPAFADVLWEPHGNGFYERHRDECTHEDRYYLANGQAGYVTMRDGPHSAGEVVNIPNGTRLFVGFTWREAGGAWAVGSYAVQEKGQTWKWYYGWIPMDDLALIYDYIAFEEDHGSEFQEYDGSGDGLTQVRLYDYPGGPYSDYTEIEVQDGSFSEAFQYLYTDENGLRWTFLAYYMGRRNAWVCIDDPLGEGPGTDGYRTVAQVRGEKEELIPAAEVLPAAKGGAAWVLPAVLIVAAAAVTAVIVRKRNKKA